MTQVSTAQLLNILTPLEDAVGSTPLLPIRRLTAHIPHVKILAKAEWLNPGGSVKDRAALEMMREGVTRGELHPGKTILEATSGNTGIALAMFGAAAGYPVRLCLPDNASPERKRILRAYGAEIITTDRLEGTDGAILKARQLAREAPERYFYPDQYNNPANWRVHYRTTANEIWEQTGGAITHFVAGLGTSGTFTGTTRRLKELSPAVRCISVQPASPLHGIEGLKHMPSSLRPGIYEPSLADVAEEVSTEEAYTFTLRLAREEGFFVGLSSGAAFAVALRVAEKLDGALSPSAARANASRGASGAVSSTIVGGGAPTAESKGVGPHEPITAVVVTVFPDGGEKYLSESLWQEVSQPQ